MSNELLNVDCQLRMTPVATVDPSPPTIIHLRQIRVRSHVPYSVIHLHCCESLQSDLFLFHLQFHSVILFHLVKPWLRFPFACRAGAFPAMHHNGTSNLTAYEP